ncbi:MAG: hypothetical protein VX738_11440 [Planctomycetota bacterium]|nr:hypothetical protein [Planctomycetota bacterium]
MSNAVHFRCPHCDYQAMLPPNFLGQQCVCGGCGQTVVVTDQAAVAVAQSTAQREQPQQRSKTGLILGILGGVFVGVVAVCGGGIWYLFYGMNADVLPDVTQVTGTVHMDNQPFSGATVTLHPRQSEPYGGMVGRYAMAITDEDGHFSLATVYAVSGQPAVVSVDGVQAAEYMLTVTKAPAVTSNFPIQGPDDDPLAEYLSDHDLNATEEDGDVMESDAALFVAEFRSGNDITVSDSVEPINLTITLSSSGENRISK